MQRILAVLTVLVFPLCLVGRVVKLEQIERYDVFNGQSIGLRGSYEWLSGIAVFEIDPKNPRNRSIADVDLAMVNGKGMIEFKSPFLLLHAKDLSKRNGLCLLEVSNRGGKALLSMYNGARTGQVRPNVPKDFGNLWLLEQGYMLAWIAWEWDIPMSPGSFGIELSPLEYRPGNPITGLVRADWVVDQNTDQLFLGNRNLKSYPPVVNPSFNILTSRLGLDTPKETISPDQYTIINDSSGQGLHQIKLQKGFEAGKIYELIYLAKDPVLAGLGLVAVRDFASYLKSSECILQPSRHVIGQGISQTGRFLRQYLHDGFNLDEQNRTALDGMMIYMAGAGRGSFNHRFGQPSRDAQRYSSFHYPIDLYPFASDEYHLDQSKNVGYYQWDGKIKIFYINSGYEYWARGASLIHTTSDGIQDLKLPPHERYFHIASMQHFGEALPDSTARIDLRYTIYKGNPIWTAPYFRALLSQMKDWLTENKEPIDNLIPTIQSGNLVPYKKFQLPYIPGLDKPISPYYPQSRYYGSRWESHKIIDQEPPLPGISFPVFIPCTDSIGNESSGLRALELRVPLATYTPWGLRYGLANPREMIDFRGLCIPLPKSKLNTTSQDQRPTTSGLYKDKSEYLKKIDGEILNLVAERLLLPADSVELKLQASRLWDRVVSLQ
jgi:hypothetical protein